VRSLAAKVSALLGRVAELEERNKELSASSLRDSLTGLGNRLALDEDLVQLEARVARYGHRYCIALLDVDYFRSYNDTYGHQAGDQALRTVAAQFKEEARRGDAVYRYGGEEFLCIFPEQSLATASVAVQRIRSNLQALAVPHAHNPLGVLTLSAGLAVLDAGRTRSAAQVLKEADDALYRAKQLGRNRVEHSSLRPAA
jgi:diguanylate cyclase (GGDEF)-like protein